MQVLIVRKATNLELHGKKVRANVKYGSLREENITKLQLAHDQHYKALDLLHKSLEKHSIQFREIGRESDWPKRYEFDVVISVGGDGTLLSASHHLKTKKKILGIRSSGASVGYLCCASLGTIERTINKLAAGSLNFVEVNRLAAKVFHANNKTFEVSEPILNDILFTNVNPAATSRYKITFGEARELHKSSGVWIATATGSTAGIYAAGGTRLKLVDRRFQFRVRELYTLRSDKNKKITGRIFDPDATSLTIENRSEKAMLALDGQHGEVLLDYGDRVEIIRAPLLYLARPDRPK